MYPHRKYCILYVITQEVCSHTKSLYSYRKYVYLHRKYVLIQKVCTVLAQKVCTHSGRAIAKMCTYSLVCGGVRAGFFLEARGRKTLEVEGTGLDTGETCGLFAFGVDGEGDGVDCEGDSFG